MIIFASLNINPENHPIWNNLRHLSNCHLSAN